MDADSDEAARQADGVMVISAWTAGKEGRLLARVTMTADPADPDASEVRVVATLDELHALLDVWFSRLADSDR